MDRSRRETIATEDDGIRLDVAVSRIADCSRASAREMLSLGHVLVDERIARMRDKGRRLAAGTVVEIIVGAEELERLRPSEGGLVVLAEGTGWVAVDKPAGLAVHPLRSGETDSLLQRIARRWPAIEGVGEGGLRSGVVHRLDVDTSGVQLFALEESTFLRLRGAFRDHRMDKVYRAVVDGLCGGSEATHGELDLELEIVAHRPARVRAVPIGEGGSGARRCATRWRRLESFGQASLVEARPRTGFLHQIRASFAWMGHPLLGDATYASEGIAARAPRHLLHAARLSLDEIAVESPDPADFAEVLDRLRADAHDDAD